MPAAAGPYALGSKCNFYFRNNSTGPRAACPQAGQQAVLFRLIPRATGHFVLLNRGLILQKHVLL